MGKRVTSSLTTTAGEAKIPQAALEPLYDIVA